MSLSQCFVDSISPENKPSGVLQGVVARLKRVGEGIYEFNCFIYRLLNNFPVFDSMPFSSTWRCLVPPSPELLGGWVEWTITLVYILLFDHLSSSFLHAANLIPTPSLEVCWPLWSTVVCLPVLFVLMAFYHIYSFIFIWWGLEISICVCSIFHVW